MDPDTTLLWLITFVSLCRAKRCLSLCCMTITLRIPLYSLDNVSCDLNSASCSSSNSPDSFECRAIGSGLGANLKSNYIKNNYRLNMLVKYDKCSVLEQFSP